MTGSDARLRASCCSPSSRAGCACTPGRTAETIRWEGLNRGVYKFNDTVDRAALKPVAKGYKKITPHWIRIGIGNFFAQPRLSRDDPESVLAGQGQARRCAIRGASC